MPKEQQFTIRCIDYRHSPPKDTVRTFRSHSSYLKWFGKNARDSPYTDITESTSTHVEIRPASHKPTLFDHGQERNAPVS